MSNKKVLLTGVTGFLGSHTTIQLLNKDFDVIGTLRSRDRISSIREIIGKYSPNINNLTFAEADLSDEEIWLDLTKGVDYVLHIASPFPRELPKHENELIEPAKRGTLNILKAATANSVKRVVMVSALGTITYGKTKEELSNVFDEDDWTDESNLKDTTAYYRSKTIAEKAAWDFLEEEESKLEFTTICPAAILGPVIDNDYGTSANIIIGLLNGSLPALPKIEFDIVDVRSVADLLIKAMEMPQAVNNRYIASAGHYNYKEIAQILKQQYPERTIPTFLLPDFITKIFSIFQPLLKPVLLENVTRKINSGKAAKDLNWQPLSAKEAILSCAESVLESKIVI
ncbi:SDR family oxidoreductase [Chryseobacterium indoltheticum]|uniref:Nucleoside-diphosphate-sugar epimerase n=1 Tax=Chryseobacterium indoltheticum TaxID=254 RepID=A0A381FB88_9FLAO|nr:aldehyde reductase [Chryseobacterium indoltheticum]AZA73702.1 aldehyde reductase [Chryseobacterium indoltheticum]SIQ92130.1 Nucleoside-diphosphate-sugar epimerase [Chryseobacterium indoltheticum]SUX43797.1 Polymyxin resistance protein PmrI [Chryseobacterium indoltheticum]